MSDKRWIEEGRGMYVRAPTRGAYKGETLYCARIRVNGRYKHVILGAFSGIRKAEAKLNEVLGDPSAALEQRRRRREAVTFGEVLDRFFDGYRSRNGTSDYYASVLKPVRDYFGDTPPSEIDATAVDRYLDSRRALRTQKGAVRIGESTLRKECIALGTAFKWAMQRNLLKANPLRDYNKPKEPKVNGIVILTREQEPALREAALSETRVPLWDVLEWALYSGMRIEEITERLEWSDVDEAGGLVAVKPGKTGKARSFPRNLSARLPAILERRRAAGVQSVLVFCDSNGQPLDRDVLNGALERAEKAAGIPKAEGCLWNRYRHTWATRLMASGRVSPFEAAKWMGNSLAIFEHHYAKYQPGEHEHAAGALDQESRKVAPSAAPRRRGRLQLVK